MKPGWNPIRRNKNIGTKKSGHSKTNLFYTPGKADELILKNINSQSVITVNGLEFSFIVEELYDEYMHCCTADEISKVLSFIPQCDLEGLRFIILKQPTKKEEMLRPCWGRVIYNFSYNKKSGSAIILYAINIEKEIFWRNSLNPQGIRELENLKDEGHLVFMEGKNIRIKSSFNSAKMTQLYRTLFHEVGHLIYFKNFIKEHNNTDFAGICELYFKRPVEQREDYAITYASHIRKRLLTENLIPL